MNKCENCGAEVPHPLFPSVDGRAICCAHCVFNPLGCRCQLGEFGVAETFDFGDVVEVQLLAPPYEGEVSTWVDGICTPGASIG